MKPSALSASTPARWELGLCLGIFCLALGLRLACLWQYAQSPDFFIPFGDAKLNVDRALTLLNVIPGPALGADASSPLYPLWLALLFKLAGPNLWLPRIFQAVLGSLNCLLIYALAKRLHGNRAATGAAAGIMAAGCGILVLLDADLLMISLTLFFLSATLVSLIFAREKASLLWAGTAGVAFGLVVSDRTALLPFLLPAAWYLGNGLTWKFSRNDWYGKTPLVFAAATLLVIAPISLQRLIQYGDLILVSSNAGVNFYIGNHPGANGAFHIPPESGLQLGSLAFFDSARSVAEQARGAGLKPSQVSRYWFQQGLAAWHGRGPEMAKLYFDKLKWMFNAREISNHLDFEYYRREVAPILSGCLFGFGLLVPGAFLGLARYFKNRPSAEERLWACGIAVIVITLLPFFVVDRYRAPLAPFLIVLSAIGISEVWEAGLKRQWKTLGWAAALVAAGWFAAHAQPLYMPFSDARLALGNRWVERGQQNAGSRERDWPLAILQFKQAIEDYRPYRDGYQALANLYMTLGYYSGVIAVLDAWAEIEPAALRNPENASLRAAAVSRFQAEGNQVPAAVIPKTDYEQAVDLEQQGHPQEAIARYRRILQRDPYQADAAWRWADAERRRGNQPAAIRILKQSLAFHPGKPALVQLLEQCYSEAGDRDAAASVRRHWPSGR